VRSNVPTGTAAMVHLVQVGTGLPGPYDLLFVLPLVVILPVVGN
jgi:hypothetical protein